MIRANELRIGNLLTYGERIGKVIEITNSYTPVCIIEFDDGEKQGISAQANCLIPMTEERLLQFGFVSYIENCFELRLENFELIIFNSETPVAKANDVREGEYYILINRTLFKYKYIHQIQNIYFALRSEELELKK